MYMTLINNVYGNPSREKSMETYNIRKYYMCEYAAM